LCIGVRHRRSLTLPPAPGIGRPPLPLRPGQYVSLDCEFVGLYDPANDHAEHSLARVSIVNFHGAIVLDTFVAQRERIGDWRTWVSGVRPEDVKGGWSRGLCSCRVNDSAHARLASTLGSPILRRSAEAGRRHPQRTDTRRTRRTERSQGEAAIGLIDRHS
jgi:hypothetical protein